MHRYLYLSKLVTVPGASGAVMRLLLDQVTNISFCSQLSDPRPPHPRKKKSVSVVLFLRHFLFSWSDCCKIFFSFYAVHFLSHFHWGFLVYIDHTRGKAFTSCAQASAGCFVLKALRNFPRFIVPCLVQKIDLKSIPCNLECKLVTSYWLLLFPSCRSGFLLSSQIGNFGFLFSFSISGLSLSNSRYHFTLYLASLLFST